MLDNRLTVIGKHLGYDYESITVNTAIGLTATKLSIVGKRPIRVICTLETAPIRYRYDGTGTNPTASEGHFMTPRSHLIIEGIGNMKNIRFIKSGTVSGVLKCTYER